MMATAHLFTSLVILFQTIVITQSAYCCSGNDYTDMTTANAAGYAEEDCVDWKCGDCACIALWDPVCCDGEEYSNSGCATCYGYNDCDSGSCAANVTETATE